MTVTINGTTGLATDSTSAVVEAVSLNHPSSATAAITMDASNNVTLASNLTMTGGVYLGGTGSDNLISDYEQGTFNLTVTGSSSNPSTTQTIPGVYTKIGRQVTILAQNLASTINTTGASGYIVFTGLPFTTNTSGVGSIMSYNGATFVYDGGAVSLFADNVVYVYENASNTYWRTVNHNPNSTVFFKISGTYFTTE